MICESVNSDHEEKEGDLLNGNCIIKLKNLIANIDTFLMCKECPQDSDLHIKLEGKKTWKISLIMLILSGVVRAFFCPHKLIFLSYGR